MSLLLFGTGGRVAIAVAGAGAKQLTGTTTLSIAHPASVGAGNLLVALRVLWAQATATATDASGWTPGPDLYGGNDLNTTDSHGTRVRADYKEAAGGETGSVGFAQSASTVGAIGIMFRCTKAAGTTWDVAGVSGDDASHAANRSVTSSGTVSLAAGDVVFAVAAVDTDASMTISSNTIAATGITFGTTNRQTSGAGSGTGIDGNVEVFTAAVTAGSGTQALSLDFSTATLQCGPVAFLRLREVTAATAPPPYQPVRRMQPYLVR